MSSRADRLGVALIGSGWISRQYAEALRRIDGAQLLGVASRDPANAARLAAEFGASSVAGFDELGPLLDDPAIDVVCVNSPNHLHARHAIAAADAGKHVIVEKPLCMTLAEADAIAASSRAASRGLGYAENLCFAPLYRRARDLLAGGEIGRVHWARQVEKHGGPYSPWFWCANEAGGGALADMGCHGIECLRWLLGKPPIRRVAARLSRLLHREKTALEDDARVVLELEDGRYVVSESSWAVVSGMQSRLEVHGSAGSLEADLMAGSLRLFRTGRGWTELPGSSPAEAGYPPELEHFFECFRSGEAPSEGGDDGRAVLEILCAAYASAARGRAIELPFDPGPVLRPVDLWLSSDRR